MNPVLRRRLWRAGVGLVLLAAAYGLHRFRHPWYVNTWFNDGGHGASAATLAARDESAPSWAPAARVRVVLLDGLRADLARTLPNLSRMCTLDLGLDSGFPTVSLPVQHVLWTGMTQQQSGVEYRLDELTPPPVGIPNLVSNSRAVAESHAQIIRSFGFTDTYPERGVDDPTWRDAGFIATAADLVTSDAPLVFVHVLRIDDAGHKYGGTSPQARAAAADADRWLGQLLSADAAAHTDGGTRWFVLADHGQLRKGGHGDAEPEVRITRLCIGGALPPGASVPPHTTIHMVDLSRTIADSLGVTFPGRTVGRPFAAAVAHPAHDATLPWPSPLEIALATVLLGVGAAASALAALRERRANLFLILPLWWIAGFAALLITRGQPTLSNPVVWSPKGKYMAEAAFPGFVFLAAASALAFARGATTARVLAGQLAFPAAATAAVLVLSGVVETFTQGTPPLIPYFSGFASAALLIFVSGAVALALALLATAVLPGFDRSEAPGSGDRAG